MAKEKDLLKVGKYNLEFNDILKTNIQDLDIYMSKGLPSHMIKRKHFKCLKYIDNVSEIITNPDYIGINPNEQDSSIELVKKYEDNVMVGIKIDTNNNYLYISTIHDIQESKINRRLYSGRLKKFTIDSEQN